MPSHARATIVAAMALLALAGLARADTANSTLNVRVLVQSGCTLSSSTLDFGTYSSGQAADLNGFTQIAFSSCPQGRLRFELDGGANGTAGGRRLADGRGSFLSYALYRDSARTLPFGQGSDARAVTLPTPGSGRVSVYGRIPGNQLVAPGTYTDTVVVVLTF